MIRLALPLTLFAAFAVAAPVPKQDQDALRKAFGTFAETDDGGVAFADGRLTLTGKKRRHDFFDNGRPVAYRTERDAAGDFEMSATLLTTTRPKQAKLTDDVRAWSGLYIRVGAKTIRFGKLVRTVTHENKESRDESLWFQHDGTGTRIDGCNHDAVADVRLVKTAESVELFTRDGKNEWARRHTVKAALGDEATVGVFLLVEADHPIEATFADFRLTTGK